ncbi:DMA3 [Auxenochlorella protothecoides x Auxenochlorella symbiontica]
MKLKELESLMQEVSPFLQPKVELEQYPTGAHLASRLLYTVANSYGEFEGKVVADLGCGTGMLAIGAAALGAGQVLAFDLDQDALETAQENVRGIFGDSDDEADDDGAAQIEFVRSDVRLLAEQQPRLHVDTVIMNPPFGTRQKGPALPRREGPGSAQALRNRQPPHSSTAARGRHGLPQGSGGHRRHQRVLSAQDVDARLHPKVCGQDPGPGPWGGDCRGAAALRPAAHLRLSQAKVQGHRGRPVAVPDELMAGDRRHASIKHAQLSVSPQSVPWVDPPWTSSSG